MTPPRVDRHRFLLKALLVVLAGSSPITAGGQRRSAPQAALPAFSGERDLRAFLTPSAEAVAARRAAMAVAAAQVAAEAAATCPGSTTTTTITSSVLGAASSVSVPAIVSGRLRVASGAGLSGGVVDIAPPAIAVTTGADGSFRLTVPADSLPDARVARIRARAIGYRPHASDLVLRRGDSVQVEISLCRDVNRLNEVAVTGIARSTLPFSITNSQHADVDEGGIVKLVGEHLLVLRRGRLFTVAVGDRTLRPVASIDAFAPGTDPGRAWYDELLVHRDRAIVIGFSYEHSATELNLFRVGADGSLTHEESHHLRSDDYYSSRNYASRVVGDRLVLYAPRFLDPTDDAMATLPALRRWPPQARTAGFERLVTPQRVYRAVSALDPDDAYATHAIASCDLAARPLECTATAVIGPEGEVFYVSPSAVYLWLSQWERESHGRTASGTLIRMPFDGSAPRAIGVVGSPVDQFSFLEDDDGHLNVLVSWEGGGDWMWRSEQNAEAIALLRLRLDEFGDGSTEVAASRFRILPSPGEGVFHNRFVGRHLLYGGGNGWGAVASAPAALFVVPWAGGPISRVELPHGTDRIEVLGNDAVVVGSDSNALYFTGVRLDRQPRIVQRHVLRGAAQGELRSHGFFYRRDDEWRGVLGLPVRSAGAPGWQHLVAGSASVVYLRNDGDAFVPLGRLDAERAAPGDDGCRASCVDWYGNARPIFLGSRVFALMGYELVEGRIADGALFEVARVSFAPAPARVRAP